MHDESCAPERRVRPRHYKVECIDENTFTSTVVCLQTAVGVNQSSNLEASAANHKKTAQ